MAYDGKISDSEILDALLRPEVRVPLEKEHSKDVLRLSEPKAPDSRADIRGMPHDAIVFKPDLFPVPEAVFQGRKGECDRADFIIISELRRVVLYIEMKQSGGKAWKVTRQLKGAFCCLKYCQAIGREFWGKSDFLEGYRDRFVAITNTGPQKQKSVEYKSAPVHDCPEKFMKMSSPHYLQFNKLVGG